MGKEHKGFWGRKTARVTAGRGMVRALCLAVAIAPFAGVQAQDPFCDHDAVAEARDWFDEVRREYVANPAVIDRNIFRRAAEDYMAAAAACYPAESQGNTGQMIDQGGVWFDDGAAPEGMASGDYVLFGTKWGAGSPLTGGTDVDGPRLPGGVVTYSYMPAGVDFSQEPSAPPDTNTPISGLPTFDVCFLEEIDRALAAWSAVADVQFQPVPDGGGPFNDEPNADIRIGAHSFDGASGTLAHAYFPPPNGLYAAGDVHFDKDEPWFCDSALGAIDFGIVALHEFGHALGLNHEATDIAVMNAFYNPQLNYGPLADDIIGIGELYDTAGAATKTFFGKVGFGTETPEQSIHVEDGQVLVRDTGPAVQARTLLKLSNPGNTKFEIENSDAASSWAFTNSGNDFRISRQGSGIVEFYVKNNGDAVLAGLLQENSDRNAKTNIVALKPEDVLEKVTQLPIAQWSYRDAPETRHIGPMAQDFRAAFGTGPSDTTLATMDVGGVAIASIQALAERNRELERRNASLEQRLERIERLLRDTHFER